ncbi:MULTISPECIES: sigma factor [unclassified Mucilaginibacter]|uniref:sigma factor n=1 Tax=unclassified Mucilaginibacter TaxID=2617802 RepID=UPI002AC95488|nr:MULTISPECIES: sigma factor [unclassified Mucilaginibacter]MEB0260302.1 sigma factor [Mucilaginibacter sp. 10I4]MEB0277287.1 sigma factor [Mucilaginibacter sp. 10B2]MEB0303194.1 sigma factor [Mucilaginibacter sp. 5C4]WPX25413.1 sigma factor [Mucilaginibacter sp. 5C4]
MIIRKPGVDDAELVRLILLKSRAGAEVLYDRYAMVLLLVIIRIIPEKKEAEAVLEQTFIKVWNSFDVYIQQNGKLLPWMIVIARNLIKDTVKGKIIRPKTAVKT